MDGINTTRRRPGWLGARRGVRGQATVWLLGTLVATSAVLYGVYNVSQLTVGKQRAVNAADAAALAGATVEARLLNLMAYNNRAMVANEVFLIQMLSLESWTQYFKNTADNIGYVLDVLGIFIWPLEYAGQVLHELASVADEGHELLGQAMGPLIQVIEGAKQVFYAPNVGVHGIARLSGALLAEDAANQIVEANRAAFGTHQDAGVQLDRRPAVLGLTLLANARDWTGFTKQYGRQGDDRLDAKNVLLASRDGFTTARPGAWWLKAGVPFVGGLDKDGGAQLKGYERWETQDTLELWTKGPKGRKVYTPIGWGRSNADPDGTAGETWSPRRTAQKNAYRAGTKNAGWSGVPQVYDVSDKREASRDRLGLDFTVVVSRPAAHTLTTGRLGMGSTAPLPTGASAMPERLASDRLSAIGKARVFFERPRRGLVNDFTASSLWRPDSAKEHGSTFSPYWQARLADTSSGQKMALLAAMGLTPDHALYTPGGQ